MVRLSVPVEVIVWKDSKMTYNVLMATLNPTHSLHGSHWVRLEDIPEKERQKLLYILVFT